MKTIAPLLFLAVLALSSCNLQNSQQSEELSQLQAELDSLNQYIADNPIEDQGKIATFLTFQEENAEEAMNFYMGLFDNSEIVQLTRWEEGAPGKEGTIMHAVFTLNGKLFMCSDSPPVHEWGFTPAVSNFVTCVDQSEIERLFTALSEGGNVMMPLDNYGFSQQFGFVEDRFGVSWQLNLD